MYLYVPFLQKLFTCKLIYEPLDMTKYQIEMFAAIKTVILQLISIFYLISKM